MQTLYLDTSIPSAYFDSSVIERQKETIKFWENVLPEYDAYISEITLQELNDTKDPALKSNMAKLVECCTVLKADSLVENLADAYIENGIIPEKYYEDALHIAIATFNKMLFLVSWNFEHLVKVKTRKLVNSVNTLKGHKSIEIISPREL